MSIECNVDFDAWVGHHAVLKEFIQQTIALCEPDRLHIASGSDEEYDIVRCNLYATPE